MQRCTCARLEGKRLAMFVSFLCFFLTSNLYLTAGNDHHAALSDTYFNPAAPAPVCVGQLTVSLQAGCQALLEAQDVLAGLPAEADPSAYQVLVKDADESNLGVADGCGSYLYEVTGPAGFSCWGRVLAEDKQLPAITCPEPATAYEGRPFVCTDLDTILLKGVWQYTADREGNILEIPAALKKILLITGFPAVSDNCGDLTITVSDLLYTPEDRCEQSVITRTFTATDACRELATSCTQQIFIGIPGLEDLMPPDELVKLACDEEIKLDAKGHPHPDVTGYPSMETAFGTYPLDQTFCVLGAGYEDGEIIEICDGTYKLSRHWQVLDWCNPGEIREFFQIIKVGDEQGPEVSCPEVDYDHDGISDPMVFSSGPYDCTAAFEVPLPTVTDNCSGWSVLTEILPEGAAGEVIAVILPGKARYVSGIARGCYQFRYTVSDNCGNKTVLLCPFSVQDLVAPVAACNDDLNVSLGGEGYARVSAAEIDEGSSDNCGPIRVEARRRIRDLTAYECLDLFDLDGNGVVIGDEVRLSAEFGDPDEDGFVDFYYYTEWAEFVDFTCCDMNENVRIELRVWDDRNGNGRAGDETSIAGCQDHEERILADNFNVCWLDVLVEDKIAPTCLPPLAREMDCNDLPYDFDPQDELLMTALFGAAQGNDNCPGWTVTELDAQTAELDECEGGSFVRRFQVTDAKGIQSAICEQLITLHAYHDYWIGFPADAEANCGVPLVDTITTEDVACDLLAVSAKDEFFSASGDECYKIFRTFSVINWCEYDGESDPVVVSRDEDCDGLPGDEAVYVIVLTNKEPDPCHDYYGAGQSRRYQHVWYDRDYSPFNSIPAAGTKGDGCDYETNPTGFWKEVAPVTENEKPDKDGYPGNGKLHCEIASVGYWQYTQVIKVYDNVDPVILPTVPQQFCSFSSDIGNNCPDAVELEFQIEENCTPEDLQVTVLLDLYRDALTEEDLTPVLVSNYPDYRLSGNFPIGQHQLIVLVKDGCGNTARSELLFEVEDCKAPTPTCINGLAIELMPVLPPADVDSDGEDDFAAMTIWATDFIASPAVDCSGEVTYSINRSEDPHVPGQSSLVLTCKDGPNALIQIWAYDAAGNGDFCETYLFVQDNMVNCPGIGHAAIAGAIRTETQEMVQGVQVALSGQSAHSQMTPANGEYGFDELEAGFDYTITPQKDSDPLNGVTTFDLVLMTKHILGIQSLDGPYKRIAADINNDKRITAQDAIALRRLILNIDLDFEHNTSWRFVSSAYIFPQAGNPWAAVFPEVINVNQLEEGLGKQDFVAVKIGDLNGDSRANALSAAPRSTAGRYALRLENRELQAGNTYRIDLSAGQIEGIQGFQATFGLDPQQVELAGILENRLRAEHFGRRFLEDGFLTASWHQVGENDVLTAEEILFSLVVQAKVNTTVAAALQVNSRHTAAEAYDSSGRLLEFALEFEQAPQSAAFQLEQNSPNPFRESTRIGFYLPEAGEVHLRIYDASGRELRCINAYYGQGRHAINLRMDELGAAGVLYYTLTSGRFTAGRKMVLIRDGR